MTLLATRMGAAKTPATAANCPGAWSNLDERFDMAHISADERLARIAALIGQSDDCWLWQGAVGKDGYGRYGWPARPAHRLVYEAVVGLVPEGLCLDHLCRVRKCVRPDHLEPVTNRENVLRGVGLTAQHARKTRCPQGHLYDEANTYRYKETRRCRACDNAANKRRYAARKSPAPDSLSLGAPFGLLGDVQGQQK